MFAILNLYSRAMGTGERGGWYVGSSKHTVLKYRIIKYIINNRGDRVL